MSIYPDKKGGQLTGRFVVEVQLDGSRKRGRFASLNEAKAAEKRFLAEFAGHVPEIIKPSSADAPRTLFDLFRLMAPLRYAHNHGRREDIERKLRILQSWGVDLSLSVIDIHWVDNVTRILQAKGSAPATINRYLTSVRPVIAWGHKRGYLDSMPTFEWQSTSAGRIRVISFDEERRLLTILKEGFPEVADFVACAIDTGCRYGELAAVQPQDVEGEWLTVMMEDQGTKKHHRRVPLTARAKEILARVLPWGISYGDIRWAWSQAAKQMGLDNDPGWVLHACRHTCATRLCAADVNLVVVQRFLGHTNIQTTVRYSHPDEDMLLRAASKLGPTPNPTPVPHRAGRALIQPDPRVTLPEVRYRRNRVQTQEKPAGEVLPFPATGVADDVE